MPHSRSERRNRLARRLAPLALGLIGSAGGIAGAALVPDDAVRAAPVETVLQPAAAQPALAHTAAAQPALANAPAARPAYAQWAFGLPLRRTARAAARDTAQWPAEPIEGRTVQRGSVSLQEAVAMAQRRYPGGRVVRAETRTRNGNRVHEIRIIDAEGRVRTVRIDADGRNGG